MSPLELTVVQRKLTYIAENITRLEPVAKLDLASWLSDETELLRDASLHRLQTCIEAAVDINAHLLVGAGHPAPTTSRESFIELANKLQAIPRTLANQLAPSAGLRNWIVHIYDGLDEAQVLGGIQNAVALYPEYIGAIEIYLTPTKDNQPPTEPLA